MILRVNNLKVCFKKFIALDIKAPIVVEEGDRVGVIGSNGAGKTTFIKSILGLLPYEGNIETNIEKEEMAVHMQFNEYIDSMAVQYIMEAILDTKIAKNPKLQELIQYFEFEGCLKKKYSKLSGGQKQRFTIILVMMQDAKLTFYDEVTSGLDFETRQKLMEKLVEWYRDKKSSLIMVSHYYEELEQMANKLLILDQGTVIDYGKKEELFKKYCGNAVIVLENTVENEKITEGYKRLCAPANSIALACEDAEVEKEIVQKLIKNNVNYKRSNNDIEMVYINAKNQKERKEGAYKE